MKLLPSPSPRAQQRCLYCQHQALLVSDWNEQNIPICMGQRMIIIKQEPIQNGSAGRPSTLLSCLPGMLDG